jgi:hypothetical protein
MVVQFQQFSIMLAVGVNCFIFITAQQENGHTLQPQLLSSPLSRSYPSPLTPILMMTIIQASSYSCTFCDGFALLQKLI